MTNSMMPRSDRRSVSTLHARARAASRAGFSLVEIVVAMLLLSVTLLALAALMTQVAGQGRTTEITSQRNAVLGQHVNYFTSLSYSAIDAGLAGCESIDEAMMTYERCVEITNNGLSKQIKIRITPENTAYKPDSAMFERTAPPVNPFNVGN